MKREEYHHRMVESKHLTSTDRTAYWKGYMRGLRLAYHGKKYETREEHRKWMDLINDVDEVKRDMGKGYRDGIKD